MSTKLITKAPVEAWLGFDPSLRNTGWIVILGGDVWDRGVFNTEPGEDLKGIADNIRRANEIGDAAHELIWKHMRRPSGLRLAAELPAVHGHRIDSALLSSQAIYSAGSHLIDEPMVFINSQHAKKRVAGDAKASKQKLKAAVLKLLPGLEGTPYPGTGGLFNEHIADAAAVAIVAATEYEESKRG